MTYRHLFQMDEGVFPPANLAAHYSSGEFEGLPTRELRRFEVFDSEGRYAPLKSGLTLAGELAPTVAGKKENPDVRVVVVTLHEVNEVRLRGDAGKFATFSFWIRTPRAWYCLKNPHPDYADFFREHAAQCAMVPLVAREMSSKNPRTFERTVHRICKEAKEKPEVADFVDRFGSFLLAHFAGSEASEFLTELKKHVVERGATRYTWPVPELRLREVNRECNKGNEWACQLLGLPPPQKVEAPKKKRSRASEGGAAGGEGAAGEATSPSSSSTVSKRGTQGVEDMSLPGAATEKRHEFKKLLLVPGVSQSHLKDVFAVSEFVSAFGSRVLGREDADISPSLVQEWITSTRVPVEFEVFLCDLMTFIGTESRDPSVKGFGQTATAAGGGTSAVVEEEPQAMDEDGGSSIPYVGRLRKLVTFLAPLTWCEVLRRVLHIFRADLSADFMRDVFGALERWDFGSLEAGRKLEVIVFLVKKCFQSKRLHDAVDESLANVTRLKGLKNKAVKEVRAEFAELLKKPLPPKPELNPEVIALLKEVAEREAAQEQLRASGKTDRSEMSKTTREIGKLRTQAEDLQASLQNEYDEVALAPSRRDQALVVVDQEFDPQIAEEKALLRNEPLGQDRYRRTFWYFGAHRDTHDIVLVQDGQSWSMIDSADELQKLRNSLNVRGMREKRLRAGIDEAIPRMRQFAEEEAEVLSNPRRRRDVREYVFGRAVPNGGADDEENDEEAAEKLAKQEKKRVSAGAVALGEEEQLSRMQSHLTKCIQELPTGCVKSKDIERISGMVNKTSSARELANVLLELEAAVVSGWLSKPWQKERASWELACKVDDLSYSALAFLMYMLEFSVDRYYNPKTGKSEKPASRTHENTCTACGKAGNLLCCDTCPRVYHMACLDPPLHHVPRGSWSCDKCVFKTRPSARNPLRSTRAAGISYVDNGGLVNPSRSTRKQVNYKDDNDEEDEGAAKRETRRSGRRRGRNDDDDDDDDDEDEEDVAPPPRRSTRKSKKNDDDDEDEEVEDEDGGGEEDDEDEGDDEEEDEEEEDAAPSSRRSTRKSVTRKSKRKNDDDDDDDDDEDEDEDDVAPPPRRSTRKTKKNDDDDDDGSDD